MGKNQAKISKTISNESVLKLLGQARPFGIYINMDYQELQNSMNAPFGEVFKRELCRKLEIEMDKKIIEAYRS